MNLMLDHSLAALRDTVALCNRNADKFAARGHENLAANARRNADKISAVIAAREAFAARSGRT